MSNCHLAAFLSTNVHGRSVSDRFLPACSVMLARTFNTSENLITLELQTDQNMLRAGSSAPMCNVRIYHDSDVVDSDSKHDFAKDVAKFISLQLRVPTDRVLVLFSDTRCCNNV